MAKIALQMTAVGMEPCSGCGKTFARGERMNAVELDNGTPYGWHCDTCIDQWNDGDTDER